MFTFSNQNYKLNEKCKINVTNFGNVENDFNLVKYVMIFIRNVILGCFYSTTLTIHLSETIKIGL